MNINKAIEHFEWKFKNHWKPTQKDVDAYNSIIEYKEFQERENLSKNQSLAKLLIDKLILLSRSKMYSGERSIEVIHELLSRDTFELCLILKKEIPMMRFNSVAEDKYPLIEKDVLNITRIDERNRKIVEEYETELTEAKKYEISDDNIVKFVERLVTEILHKFEYDKI